MMHRVVILLPDEMYTKIQLRAHESAMGVSTYIRQILTDHAPPISPPLHAQEKEKSISEKLVGLNNKPKLTPEQVEKINHVHPKWNDPVARAAYDEYCRTTERPVAFDTWADSQDAR